MGFSTKTQKAKPQFTGVQVQTASSALPVPLIYGAGRAAWNLIDYTDFASHKHTQRAGKGFGASATSYTYTATILGLLSEGVITGVGKAWKDSGEEADYANLGFTLFTGTVPQAPWGYMASAHPDHADGYPGFAYLAKANLDLSSAATLPQFNFEVFGLLYQTAAGGSIPDADPAQLVDDFLTDADHGVSDLVAQFLDYDQLLSGLNATTTGDSAYQTYCRAMGFGLSPVLSEQAAAAEIVERWCLITNTAPVWTGFSLKLVPYGDAEVAGHGVTYLPPTTSRFDFDDDDYIAREDEEPVIASRSDPADAKNIVKFIVRDRANAYNEVPVDFQEDNSVALTGRKEADPVKAHDVCDPAMGKVMVALYGQRVLFGRNGYEFKVGPTADLLEPMDCGTISDPELGVSIPVRLVEISEDDEDNLGMLAEQFDGTLGSPALAAAPGVTPDGINSLAAPGPVNPPVFIEPNADLAERLFGARTPCVAAAVSGGDGTTYDPDWGGCYVWVSSDGVTYQAIGTIDAPARMGKTTTGLALYGGANPDAVDTVGVTLLESNGDLTSVSAADAEAGLTLCWLGGEVLSFELATLTGPSAYTLGGDLWRGLYGTAPDAHLAAVDFVRMDNNLFSYALPEAYVGVLLYFKFQSFNVWGQALEDLAGCTAYTYTPAGTGFGGGAGGVPQTPTGLAAVGLIQAVTLSWDANPAADNVTGYEVWRATGTGQIFGAAAKAATVAGQAWTDTGLLSNQGYTYFLKAVNAVGASAATAGVDVTTSGLISGGGASAIIVAAADLAGGDFVNVYDDAGTAKVRLADASDPAKFCNGFVLGGAAAAANAIVYFTGMNTSVSPAARGRVWLSEATPGGYRDTAPATGVDQPIGTAIPGVGVAFQPQTTFQL